MSPTLPVLFHHLKYHIKTEGAMLECHNYLISGHRDLKLKGVLIECFLNTVVW